MEILKELIGKEVQLYPNDTYKKWGIIENVDNFGIVFRITRVDTGGHYITGERRYISHSSNLTLKL